jgi:nucleoside 2-deoxyribosyltransferase
MQVHRYEETQEAVNAISKPSIFLAGPTVRGNQPHLTSWRFEAIEEFKRQGFDGDIIVPEFTSKIESDKGKEWIPLWEYNGLKKADCILFWIPRTRELIALTTNMEFGYWQGREPWKMIYGRPDDAYRIGYLDVMWKAVAKETGDYNPNIYNTLESTIASSIEMAKFYHQQTNNSLKFNNEK